MGKISAIDIKKLWYADEIETALTPSGLKALIEGPVYAESTSGTSGALKVVADASTPQAGEIKLGSVTPCVAGYTPQVNDYVINVGPLAKEVENIHQDTWQIEEGEASQDSYRNQLNGHVYRLGRRQMGDLTINFTVGQYDYKTKMDLMGGDMLDASGAVTTTAAEAVGWARDNEAVEMYKTIIALTVDNVFVVLSRASLGAREASTDGAIGLGMSGTMTDPRFNGVSSEYWYDYNAVYPVA